MTSLTAIGQYLTFSLGEEQYGIDVHSIREILPGGTITPIPRAPTYLLGVMNVRGTVVPVLDLRARFGRPVVGLTPQSAVVVLESDREEHDALSGILVDQVDRVVELSRDEIEPPPKLGRSAEDQFVNGMGRTNDGFILLLDIAPLLTDDEAPTADRESLEDGTPSAAPSS